MQNRTFLRIMFEKLFTDNVFIKTLFRFVKFCKEQLDYSPKMLKFNKNMPYNKNVELCLKDNRFIFQTGQKNGSYIK